MCVYMYVSKCASVCLCGFMRIYVYMSMLCVCLCAHTCYIVIYIHHKSKHQTNVNALSYGSMGACKSVFVIVTVTTYFHANIYAKIGVFLLCLHK